MGPFLNVTKETGGRLEAGRRKGAILMAFKTMVVCQVTSTLLLFSYGIEFCQFLTK